MTALEKYVEDISKNMSCNQLEMKSYFIKLAQALNADLQDKQNGNQYPTVSQLMGTLPTTTLSTVCKVLEPGMEWKYWDHNGVLTIKKEK